MQAVRLARYHTRRTHLVRFAGAYHGWWGDVQPGVGNPVVAARDLHAGRNVGADAARAAHAARHRLRAGQSAAGAASQRQRARRFRAGRQLAQRALRPRGLHRVAEAAARGLHRTRHRADLRRGVRRLPPRPRRRPGIFRRPADMVTYGKSLGGGLPIGVVCGTQELMRRFRDDRPADICFARGTFNSHPYVMTAMDEFLSRLASPNFRSVYNGLDEIWNGRARAAQRDAGRSRPAGARRQPVVDLDGQLHRAVPLQLDAAVLSARRRARTELGRHRPADFQPELHRCGFRRGGGALRRRGRRR